MIIILVAVAVARSAFPFPWNCLGLLFILQVLAIALEWGFEEQ